jgi:hypothetical protein
MILSASRRTDIPAFYSEWLMNRLKAGYALTRNPMNHSQVSKVPLGPDVVDCIVFWTKNAEGILPKLDAIDKMGYPFYFHFTLTPYGGDVEGNLPGKDALVETFKKLSGKLGPERVIWRYDPVILNDHWTIGRHEEAFQRLCCSLQSCAKVCVFSFACIYPKLKKVVESGAIRAIGEEEAVTAALSLSRISKAYGIELRSCCSSLIFSASDANRCGSARFASETGNESAKKHLRLSDLGIAKSSCIDKSLIERICGCKLKVPPDRNQRANCGCAQSVDIGAYDTCGHGCVYCYANRSAVCVQRNMGSHTPDSEFLIGDLREGEKIGERRFMSLKV